MNTSVSVGVLTYLVCLLGPIAGKLTGYGHYGWLTATTALWAPVSFSLLLLVLHVVVALARWAYRGFKQRAL